MAHRGRRRAEQQRSRAPWVLAAVAALAAVVTAAALLLWPATPGDPEPAPSPAAAPSRDGAPLDLSGLPIPRTLRCDALDDDAVATALGGPVTEREGYTEGERVEIVPGVTDVAHEDSCSYVRQGGTADARARVWVFAAPVSTARAHNLVRAERARDGCRFPDHATDFGTPGLTSVCTDRQDPGATVTLRGLFGDAWLSCELHDETETETETETDDPASLLTRADRWCVHVATTLGAVP